MKAAKTKYYRASCLADAVQLANSVDGIPKYIAGGQSLLPMMNLRLAMPDGVIDISEIVALRESMRVNDKLFIGAGTTHANIEDGRIEDITQGYLKHVASGIAYRSVRNKGTIGGSLAHSDPAADWPSALLALDAIAVLHSPEGTRNVPLADFQTGLMETCLGESEILKGILVPVLSSEARWSYTKFVRKTGEFAHSIGAVVIDRTQNLANAVLGGASDKPRKLLRLSALLASHSTTHEMSGKDFEALVEQDLIDATDHAQSSYEFHLHKTIICRAITEALKK
jgi:carbon-monoxide dehydrogenase medium subunit